MPETHVLTSGDHRAQIIEQGAALRRLTVGGRDLVYDRSSTLPWPRFSGAVLAPWPNRIADGRYRFAGADHELPVNERDRGNALHGLALWDRWHVNERSDAAITLTHELLPRPGYPFRVDLDASYRLGADGLSVMLGLTNRGAIDAPAGLSLHPYFAADDGRLDEWSLDLPCTDVIDVDERLLPRDTVPATSLGLDFRGGRSLRDVTLDHAFTGFVASSATLVGADGAGVRIGWDDACGWLQVYTLETDDASHRHAVAIEPMTCAPDAFNTGEGLRVLAPGERLATTITIAAVRV